MDLRFIAHLLFKTTFLFALLFISPIVLFANDNENNNDESHDCANDPMHEKKLIEEPLYAEKMQKMREKVYERISQLQSDDFSKDPEIIYTVPIVVHVVHRSSLDEGQSEFYSVAEVEERIEALNDGFRHISGAIYPDFPFDGVDIGIRFKLADKDPDGNPTNGITYHASNSMTETAFDGSFLPTFGWDSYKYVNIGIVHSITDENDNTYFGYATYAGEHGEEDDGVVMRYDAPDGIWVHELGHYFNVLHTNNDGTTNSCAENDNCLTEGDYVCDTAPHKKNSTGLYYGSGPCYNDNSCDEDEDDESDNNPYRSEDEGGLGDWDDPLYNYMNKGCLETFTQGQRVRMRDAIENIRESLLDFEWEGESAEIVDVSVLTINAANGLVCSDSFQPDITLENIGNITIEEMDIRVYLNGDSVYETTWEGELEENESTVVILPEVALDEFGEHQLFIEVTAVNGEEDSWSINNSGTIYFASLIPYTLEIVSNNCEAQIYSNTDAISTNVESPGCDNFQGNDVWFEVQVPESGSFVAEGIAEDFNNGGMALYTGDCGSFQLIECNTNAGDGDMPRIEAEDMMPNSTVYLRFWERSNNEFGDFGICVYDESIEGLADAGIGSVGLANANQEGGTASGEYEIEVGMQNFGASDLDDFDIEWFVDDELQDTYHHTGNAVAGASDVVINLGSYDFEEARTYEIKARTVNPNGNADGNTGNDEIEIEVEISAQVEFKVYLEGAYNVNQGEMKTTLHDLELLPLAQPYNQSPWNYNGAEEFDDYSDFPSDVVDWVLVEVRTGTPNLSGNAGTNVIERKAALLLKNGRIWDARTLAPIVFEEIAQEEAFYFVIRHRNHLDIISSEAALGDGLMIVDFTQSITAALGAEQLTELDDGKFAMFAGDYIPDAVIQITDQDAWAVNPATLYIYSLVDGSLDGVVQNTDNDLWVKNKAKLGSIEIRY